MRSRTVARWGAGGAAFAPRTPATASGAALAGPSGLGVGAPSDGSSAYASPASSSSRSSLISAMAAPGRNRVYPSRLGRGPRPPRRVGGGPYDRAHGPDSRPTADPRAAHRRGQPSAVRRHAGRARAGPIGPSIDERRDPSRCRRGDLARQTPAERPSAVRGPVPVWAAPRRARVRALGADGGGSAVPPGHRARRGNRAEPRSPHPVRAGRKQSGERRRVLRPLLVQPRPAVPGRGRDRFRPAPGAVPGVLPTADPPVGAATGTAPQGLAGRWKGRTVGHARPGPGQDPPAGPRLQDRSGVAR